MNNPNCDGSGPHSNSLTVKLYPLGGHANMILCCACFSRENIYRRDMGLFYHPPQDWPQVDWNTAKTYPQDSGTEGF